ncbi:MAG TPA: LysR substrate-binding domain-containing protein [Burkholderiales bacterium]
MNIRQLRALCEILKHGLHISAAADALHTSQSGVSKQILELEQELGVTIFLRRRNRVTGLSDAGRTLVAIAERIVKDADKMYAVAADYSGKGAGSFVVATTHLHARHTLPGFVREFARRNPEVILQLRAGTPTECCRLVAEGVADVAISLPPDSTEGLVSIPAYKLGRCLVAPIGHPLLAASRLDLKAIAKYPLITYDDTFRSRRVVRQVFEDAGLTPTVALQAIDPEICKTYVALGMGVAILPQIAYDEAVDTTLRTRDTGDLFDHGVVNLYLRRGDYLRKFVYDFIALFAPHLERETVDRFREAPAGTPAPAADMPFARRHQ